MPAQVTELIGFAAGTLRLLSVVPQLAKTLRSKKADDLSLPSLLLSSATTALYLAYGILKGLLPIIVMLSLLLILLAAQVIATLRYSHAPRVAEA
jgi:MtN3 and saliva related transmembrane protein